MSWYKLIISAEQAESGMVGEIRKTIANLHMQAGSPIGKFMHGVKRETTLDRTYYFPPKAVAFVGELLQNLGATACEDQAEDHLTIEFDRAG